MILNERVSKLYELYSEYLTFNDLAWWIIDIDDDPTSFYCNPAMCREFRLDNSSVKHSISKNCPIAGDANRFVAVGNDEKAKIIRKEFKRLCDGEVQEYHNGFPYFDEQNETTRFYSSRARLVIKNEQGKAGVLFGIIEAEKASDELYQLVKSDYLTGLNSRREFDFQINFLLDLAKRERRPISLLMCDIDFFKEFNDVKGHYAGDECLVAIAQAIRNVCARSTEVACRYGGEEFAVIVYGDKDPALYVAQSIRERVLELSIAHPNGASVSVSVGLYSVLPDANTTSRELVERADAALYESKRNGRNCCTCSSAQVSAVSC